MTNKLPKAVCHALANYKGCYGESRLRAELIHTFYAGALWGAKLAWYPPFGASLTEIRAEIRRMEKEAGK